MTCSKALLRCRAGHACELLLSAEALRCGLTKLSSEGLLRGKPLLGFGTKLASHSLRCAESLRACLPKALCLSSLRREALLSFGTKLPSEGLSCAKTLRPGLSKSLCLSRFGCKALGFRLPHGCGKALTGTEFLTG